MLEGRQGDCQPVEEELEGGGGLPPLGNARPPERVKRQPVMKRGEGSTTWVQKPAQTASRTGEALAERPKKGTRLQTGGFMERITPPISDPKKMFTEGGRGAPILLESHRENRRGDVPAVGIVKD